MILERVVSIYKIKFFITKKNSFFKDGLRYWPHTLDYQLPYKCESCPKYKTLFLNKNCSMESFWIVHFINADSMDL
jgi:hypothetical protein